MHLCLFEDYGLGAIGNRLIEALLLEVSAWSFYLFLLGCEAKASLSAWRFNKT